MTDISVPIAPELGDDINKLTRATALNILTGIVKKTPVDTGRARGNWQVNLDTPLTDITNNKTPVGTATINRGRAVINSAKDIEYPVFWITNNLPYIGKLNDGSSDQAPAKFVETEIKRVTSK